MNQQISPCCDWYSNRPFVSHVRNDEVLWYIWFCKSDRSDLRIYLSVMRLNSSVANPFSDWRNLLSARPSDFVSLSTHWKTDNRQLKTNISNQLTTNQLITNCIVVTSVYILILPWINRFLHAVIGIQTDLLFRMFEMTRFYGIYDFASLIVPTYEFT